MHTKLLWKKYTQGKQTYQQIADQHSRSKRWVQQQLSDIVVEEMDHQPGEVVLVMDTTYFRRTFGVTVWRCPHRKQNLLWKFVPWETFEQYHDGITELVQQGWKVKAIVCDGKRGLLQGFSCPVQMCHFHQAAIVTRYVTKRPKLEAGQDLQSLMRFLPTADEAQFMLWLTLWHDKWGEFLKERTTNEITGKTQFTHRRLRSAYFSLKRNIPYLFTYLRYPHLNIPNTTNSLEAIFGHVKNKVKLHRGLKRERKMKLIEELLKGKSV